MNKTSKTFWLAISLTGALLCPLVASAEANGEHPSEVNANRASSQQKDRVSGAVIDAATGEPIISATIVEDGTSNATITDYSGSFSLSFLDANARYKAIIYQDGDGADYQQNPYPLTILQQEVTASTTLTINMARSGGFAIAIYKM